MTTRELLNRSNIDKLPLFAAIYKNKDGLWQGVDNLHSIYNLPLSQLISDKDEAFYLFDLWKKKEEYVCGYVADYDRKILYYDDPLVLEFLRDPKYGQETLDYFVAIIKM